MSFFGLFSSPKCPRCGGRLTETNYSFPFPQLRCNNCIRNSIKEKEMHDRIKKLEEQVKKLTP